MYSITSEDIEILKVKAMGTERWQVRFQWTLEWVEREQRFYCQTRYWGYWQHDPKTGEWKNMEENSEENENELE